MSKTCLAVAATTALILGCLQAYAGSTFYRWEDDRGNPVHSDRPPPAGTPYEVITSGSSLIRKVDPDEGAVPATTKPSVSNDFDPVNTTQKTVQKNPDQCQRARDNLETLNTKVRIQIRNNQGELRPISEEEKEIQRKQATDTIAVHCE